MLLATTIEIYAGGLGSGCNPSVGTCGRKLGRTPDKFPKSPHLITQTDEYDALLGRPNEGKIKDEDVGGKHRQYHYSNGVTRGGYNLFIAALTKYLFLGEAGNLEKALKNLNSPAGKAAKVEYELTQKQLKSGGSTKLYRGVGEKFGYTPGVRKNPFFTSWTDSKTVAKDFSAFNRDGGLRKMLSRSCPNKLIFLSYKTSNGPFPTQREFVVLKKPLG